MTSADTTGALSGIVTAPFAPFSVATLNPGFAEDAKLSSALTDVITASSLGTKGLSFAVVDLTDDPVNTPNFGLMTPAYAGANDTSYGTIASMGKLLALYGSYQLRYDLRKYIEQQNTTTPIADINSLAQQVREIYKQEWRAAENHQNIPLIEKIFTGIDPATLDFQRGTEDDTALGSINNIDPRHTRTSGKLRNRDNLAYELDPSTGAQAPGRLHFFEQLRLMARWSNDISAAVVIESLGFPYLWQLSLGSRLFRRKWEPIGQKGRGGKSGMFLAWDYNGSHWDDKIDGWGTSPRDTPVHFRKDNPVHIDKGRIPDQGGTARSVATLLTSLAQDKLVGDGLKSFDPDGHAEMRELLRKDSNFDPVPPDAEPSPIGEAIYGAKPDWTFEQVPWKKGDDFPKNLAVSKIGQIAGHYSDAVLVRAARPKGVQIAAVLVGINRAKEDDKPLRLFGAGVAAMLDTRHPG